MKQEDAFVLSKSGKPIGNIVWTRYMAEKPRLSVERGELSGDADAILMLDAAMKKPLATKSLTIFPLCPVVEIQLPTLCCMTVILLRP